MSVTRAHQSAIDSLEYHKGCLAEATKCNRKYDMGVHQTGVDKWTTHIKRYWPDADMKLKKK